MPQTYFTADLHLAHKKIIALCGRPFSDVAHMGRSFLETFNTLVTPKDRLIILGDLGFGPPELLAEWLDGLRCKNIAVVFGNHDTTAERLAQKEPKRFLWTGKLVETKIDGIDVSLCHYAMRVWRKSHYGAYHLYGHSHGNLPDDPHALSMDVGVDCHNFTPISFAQIKARMAQKTWQPIDHHTATKSPVVVP